MLTLNHIPRMFTLPPLPYALDALEPHISKHEMELHYGVHHNGYCTKTNAAIADHPEIASRPIEAVVDDLGSIPPELRTKVRNVGGGLANHTFYWKCLAPATGKPIPKPLHDAIVAKWGSIEAFREALKTSGLGVFGSGWTWLVRMPTGELDLVTTPNQDRPDPALKKILTLDVWEHAYAYQYETNRGKYLDEVWHVIDWDAANARFLE